MRSCVRRFSAARASQSQTRAPRGWAARSRRARARAAMIVEPHSAPDFFRVLRLASGDERGRFFYGDVDKRWAAGLAPLSRPERRERMTRSARAKDAATLSHRGPGPAEIVSAPRAAGRFRADAVRGQICCFYALWEAASHTLVPQLRAYVTDEAPHATLILVESGMDGFDVRPGLCACPTPRPSHARRRRRLPTRLARPPSPLSSPCADQNASPASRRQEATVPSSRCVRCRAGAPPPARAAALTRARRTCWRSCEKRLKPARARAAAREPHDERDHHVHSPFRPALAWAPPTRQRTRSPPPPRRHS